MDAFVLYWLGGDKREEKTTGSKVSRLPIGTRI